MGLFDNIAKSRGYEKPSESSTQKGMDMSTGSSWGEIFGGASSGPSFSTFSSQKEQLAAYVDWVYAATRYIAESCSTIDLRIFINHTTTKSATLGQKLIYQPTQIRKSLAKMGTKTVIEKDAKGRLITRQAAPLEEVESHPVLDLLDSPNPYMTRLEFFEMTFLHLELAGEAFWAIQRASKNGPPVEMWPLMPNLVQVVADPEKFIVGYIYTVDGQQLPFAPEDIIHHKYSNPNDFRRGMSPVQAAARIIDTDTHMADHNRRIFYNGATVDAVLYTDNKLTDENWKRLNSQWADKYTGTQNSHKTAILENGLKYQPMALNNRDLDFLAGMNYNRDMILAIFGVPKSLLGMDESMSRANAEAAEYAFSKNKIRPKMLRLTSRITEDLAIQFGDDILVSFTDPVPDDKEFLLKEKQASVGSTNQLGWRTQNEIRAEDGDDAVEGGDELWIEGTMVPMAYAKNKPQLEEKPAVAQEDPKAPDNDDDPQAGDEEDADTGGTASDSTDTGSTSGTGDSGNSSSAGGAGSTSSDTSTGDKALEHAVMKQIAARDYPNLYDGLDIDPDDLGCIMMDLEDLGYEDIVSDYEQDLSQEDMSEGGSAGAVVPTQHGTHVTLLYGLLENGNKWKDKVDSLLNDWNLDSVQLDHVDKFDIGDSYAVVAHVKKTDNLVDGHERLTLLPHVNTFSEYKPHVTLAYINKDADVDKWVTQLGKVYNGKVVRTVGLNYGHPEEDDSEEETKGLKAEDNQAECECCMGTGEHYKTGFECYRCDASGLESDAVGDIPCDGREDSPNIVQQDDGTYEHAPNAKGHNGSKITTTTLVHSTSSKVAEDVKASKKSKAELQAMWKDYTEVRDRVSNKYENDFMKAAHQRFEEQKKEVLKNVESRYKSYKPGKNGITKGQKANVKDLFNKAKSAAKWVADLLPVYKGSVVTTGNAAFNYVAGASTQGTSGQFSGADPDIQKFYDERTTLVSKGIDETTNRLLETSLIEGISDGESVAQLADRVESIYGATAGYRALRIARTESIDSSSFATVNAWKQSGVVIGKEWHVGSSNPCPFCLEMNGTVIKLNENYFNKGDSLTVGEGDSAQTMKFNYDNVDGPPAHPNCSCSLLPVLADS